MNEIVPQSQIEESVETLETGKPVTPFLHFGGPTFQLGAPFVVEPATLVEDEEHFEVGVAKQHVRRLAGRRELVGAVRDVQALQQALADPTLTLPFAGIGQERVGLLGRDGQQA